MLKKTAFLTFLIVLISTFTVSADLDKFKSKTILVGHKADTIVGVAGGEVRAFEETVKTTKKGECIVINISSEHGLQNDEGQVPDTTIWEVLVDDIRANGPQFHHFSTLGGSSNVFETYTSNHWICNLPKGNHSVVVIVRPLDSLDTVTVGDRTIEIFCDKCK
jgi:hypothetical protein